MATKNLYVHLDGHGQELKNFSLEKFTTAELAALSGTALFDGRFAYDTTKNQIVHYDGSAWRTISNSSDSNKFGSLIGSLDASGGLPDGTTAGQVGSGVDELGAPLTTSASLQKGDFWIISVNGTIAGITGHDELSVGDILMCTVDGSTTASEWAGIQMNLQDPPVGTIFDATKTAALIAATPLSFAAEMAATTPLAMATIKSVQVIDNANGEDITSGLRIDWAAKEIESNSSIGSVTISILGSAS